MTAATVISGAGTPEAEWDRWSALRNLPGLDPSGCPRAVVVAPHPDDETLGVGGTVATLLGAGTRVSVVAVTDGEASHPGSGAVSPDHLRRRRWAEGARALRELARDQPAAATRLRLGVPDGRVRSAEDHLTDFLASLLGGEDWCLATWEGDGHPDHEATGRAARRACAVRGARLLAYPVWTWHWAVPRQPSVPWHRAVHLPLGDDALARKARAMGCFESQTGVLGGGAADGPVLSADDLDHFRRPFEVVFA